MSEEQELSPAEEKMFEIARELTRIAQVNGSGPFRDAFVGLIANVVGPMPDDYFESFISVPPCDIKGCNCATVIGPGAAIFFKMIREDWQKYASFK